jgi:hypothetical protein
MDNRIEKLYKTLRILIYLAPAVLIIYGIYIILFPNELFNFDSVSPNSSEILIQKDSTANNISLGIYPIQSHRYINLSIDTKATSKANCKKAIPNITLQKTHQAFLDPVGDQITNEDQLKQYLFDGNNSDYPNGTLLHSTATDQVFLIAKGKKILFPTPEIFRSFSYSFDNLTDVDQATLDQIPNAEINVFSWSIPHPDGTIFETYPSHKLYLIADGQKHEIISINILNDVWPKNYTIAAADLESQSAESCSGTTLQEKNGIIKCQMDVKSLPQSFGGFFHFSLEYPSSCSVTDIHIDKADINLISEKSLASIKLALQRIFGSILNRYFRG